MITCGEAVAVTHLSRAFFAETRLKAAYVNSLDSAALIRPATTLSQGEAWAERHRDSSQT